MFSIITSIKGEFNRGVDEAKLVNFRKRVRTVNEETLSEICKEIHYIMQRHFCNEIMIKNCKELLIYIDQVIQIREEIKNVKTSYNTYIGKNFATQWSYDTKKID